MNPLATLSLRSPLLIGVAGVLAFSSFSALAQYKWRDENGRIVYSDSPPPLSVKPKQVLAKPGVPVYLGVVTPENASAATAAVAPQNASTVATKRPQTPAEQEAAFKKRQADQSKAADDAAKTAADAVRKADNCNRLKGYIATIESGARIRNVAADGGKGAVLDDAQRQAELQSAKSSYASQGCQ